ncbi:hypothetical protein ADIARSV_3795 [Arcticibacter svalbardensis MN12-7]|uniref:Uncharacterized protein n=1 Tax=Arcticibacter svalbardensis MN12-7 TaxID=1150600 RepID=R9GVT1_9SPHI|nr:hypothetical protein ADIARSV_3795 [Arcticibacter svalbardensis MN12-7]
MLKRAKEDSLIAEELIPELSLNLNAEPYYEFIYEHLFLEGTICAEDLLKEIRIVANNQLASKLHAVALNNEIIKKVEFQDLWNYKLRFIYMFITEYKAFVEEKEAQMNCKQLTEIHLL